MTEELLRQGIAAAKAGHKEEAFRLLMEVTKIDSQNERAWLWLSQVVDSPQDRAVCLENVLAINPNNDNARAGLAWLAQAGTPVTLPDPVSPAMPTPAPQAEPCPRCGQPVTLAQNECAQCGLPMVILCPKCRNHIEIEQSSCPSCGLAVGDFRAGSGYHLALAEMYISHGKSDLAAPAIERAQNEAAQDDEVLVRAAELYVALGDLESALPAVEQASALASGDAGLQARLGVLYQRLGLPDQARGAFELSTRLGGDPVALLELARIEVAEGRAAEARDLLKQVTRAVPLNGEAYLLLGDAERALGHEREAIRLYEHAGQLAGRDTAVGREILSRLVDAEGRAGAETRAGGDWQWRDSEYVADGRRGERPGCVTVYALLMALPTLLGLCALAFVAAAGVNILQDQVFAAETGIDAAMLLEFLPIWIGLSVVTGGLQLAVAAGLWFMKNWARVILIVLQSIGFVGQLITTGTTLLSVGPMGLEGGVSVQLVTILISFGVLGLEAYIIYWFVTNRWRFS